MFFICSQMEAPALTDAGDIQMQTFSVTQKVVKHFNQLSFLILQSFLH